jgi:hypothetical protein
MKAQSKISPCLLAASLFLGMTALNSFAFSLLGPYADWMTETNGFRQSGDIGGPMNLGEEYRWNVPVVTYSFDASFMVYFGSNGVAAVESAISILNSLPPASQINPSNYPPEVTLINYQAAAQGLIDLKSETLFQLIQQLGLAQPTRSIFCLQNYSISNNLITGNVVQRNFDPFSAGYSIYVNDTSYFYDLVYQSTGQATTADAVEFPIDPLNETFTAVADGMLTAGSIYSGLTRDDVGGLRYLLATNNINSETLLPDVQGVGVNASLPVNGALRPGVDKITFVKVDLDSLFGGLYTPFTNQFTDTYVSNGVVVQQQLQRVINQPDFLFSATTWNGETSSAPLVVSTGTSNWVTSSAPPGFAGPGIIQPQVHITFIKPRLQVQTSDDWPPGTAYYVGNLNWGSFDNSANPPVVYPNRTTLANTNQLTLHFSLLGPNATPSQRFTWQLPVALGQTAALQTSSNLNEWVPLTIVTNSGMDISWQHSYSGHQGFFRAVPQ